MQSTNFFCTKDWKSPEWLSNMYLSEDQRRPWIPTETLPVFGLGIHFELDLTRSLFYFRDVEAWLTALRFRRTSDKPSAWLTQGPSITWDAEAPKSPRWPCSARRSPPSRTLQRPPRRGRKVGNLVITLPLRTHVVLLFMIDRECC